MLGVGWVGGGGTSAGRVVTIGILHPYGYHYQSITITIALQCID